MVTPWPIDIDCLPFLKMVDLSMAMLNNQRVIMIIMVGISWNIWIMDSWIFMIGISWNHGQ
jgi:hypothetical protein